MHYPTGGWGSFAFHRPSGPLPRPGTPREASLSGLGASGTPSGGPLERQVASESRTDPSGVPPRAAPQSSQVGSKSRRNPKARNKSPARSEGQHLLSEPALESNVFWKLITFPGK